eukprot:TRINITY_DN2975_c1_g1_i5.p1 TRINITY_DN2975_c1_g1~~TRINITY_DN2975_c1_g1_i5.p1  ORF type:complete len:362 (+),score=57.52 TRINITY_DN2975_c1_g1_i5:560-1645(+)
MLPPGLVLFFYNLLGCWAIRYCCFFLFYQLSFFSTIVCWAGFAAGLNLFFVLFHVCHCIRNLKLCAIFLPVIMSGAGKSGTPASSQDSIGLSAPPRSDDPAWKYGYIDPKNNKHVVCMYCERVIKGGRITRLKEHLGGITGEIAACKNVTPEVKWQMERLVMETQNKEKNKKRQLNEDIGNPYGNEDEELGEGSEDTDLEEKTAPPKCRKGQELQISFSSSQNRRKDIPPKAPQPPMSNYFPPRTTPGSQPSIKSAMANKEMKDTADMTIARWWFDASIPFNAARSKFFQPMVNAIASIGAGYKAPSYHDFRGKLLKKSVEEVNRLMVHYKSSWSETGCSIMADGWTDGIQRERCPIYNGQ